MMENVAPDILEGVAAPHTEYFGKHNRCQHGSGALATTQADAPMHVLVAPICGKTVAISINGNERVQNFKNKLFFKLGIPTWRFYLTIQGKRMEEDSSLSDSKVGEGSIIRMRGRLPGGMFAVPENFDPASLRQLMQEWSDKLNSMNAENVRLKEDIEKNKSNAGIRKVIQSGNKELAPKRFQNVAVSGSFRAWAREIKDYARMADPRTLRMVVIVMMLLNMGVLNI